MDEHVRIFVMAVLAAMAIGGCRNDDAPDTPRSAVPAELAGEWFTGTLSTIQYYERYRRWS
ncbi:hypothetical protein [Sandaracinus amylolyticus]|uniref:hypothetical protein n=1 Tax=Sandaracinus amylolyticus TaxID=927083 RepID=UPI001F1AC90B|nr:hypothetical protein [Sandaracinus amylolyticus]UJR85678.1 Hypothetical protein I5071_77580 [Sandaracinus amylolyticus]